MHGRSGVIYAHAYNISIIIVRLEALSSPFPYFDFKANHNMPSSFKTCSAMFVY